MSLVNQDSMSSRVSMNMKTNIIVHRPVGNFEHAGEMLNNNIEILFIGSTNDPVINKNTNDEVDRMSNGRLVVDTSVSIVGKKVIKFEKIIKGMFSQP